MSKITIGYSPAYLKWEGSHASPMRAHLAVEHIKAQAEFDGVEVEVLSPSTARTRLMEDKERLLEIHDRGYVEAMFAGTYEGHEGEQGSFVAPMMFAGTRILVQRIEDDEFARNVYFNPQGAKHHAAYNHSSGFCAFNDMAWAAHHFTQAGLRVAYLDWDAHHGDGVEDLTRSNPNVLTASIHQRGIFPGTGNKSRIKDHALNWPLERGADDEDLLEAVQDALYAIGEFKPDVLLMAIGADGHTSDPLAGLDFTVEGFAAAGAEVGRLANELDIPVLVGGAGGYQPFTYVPLVWAEVIRTMNEELHRTPKLEALFDRPAVWDEDDFIGDDLIEEEPADDRGARRQALIDALEDVPASELEDLLTSKDRDLLGDDWLAERLAERSKASTRKRKGKRRR